MAVRRDDIINHSKPNRALVDAFSKRLNMRLDGFMDFRFGFVRNGHLAAFGLDPATAQSRLALSEPRLGLFASEVSYS